MQTLDTRLSISLTHFSVAETKRRRRRGGGQSQHNCTGTNNRQERTGSSVVQDSGDVSFAQRPCGRGRQRHRHLAVAVCRTPSVLRPSVAPCKLQQTLPTLYHGNQLITCLLIFGGAISSVSFCAPLSSAHLILTVRIQSIKIDLGLGRKFSRLSGLVTSCHYTELWH
jgi:hypothetical protein